MGVTPLGNTEVSPEYISSDDFQELQPLRPCAEGVFMWIRILSRFVARSEDRSTGD